MFGRTQKILLKINAIFFCMAIGSLSAQTLKTTVQSTLKNNPDILRAKENIKASEKALERAKGDFLPSINARYATGRERTDSYSRFDSGAESEIENTLNRREASLVVSESIFSGFGSYNLVKERKQELKTSQFSTMSVREILAFQAATAHLEVLRAKSVCALIQHNIAVHRETLRKVSIKFKKGAGRKTEMDLAKGRLAQAKANLSVGNQAIQDAIAAFLKVVGYKPFRLQRKIKLPKIPQSLEQAKVTALEHNPALKISKSRFLAADKAVAVTKSLRYPRMNVELSRNNYYNLDGIKGRTKDWQGMLVFNYNLFNGGKDEASIKQAAHQRMAELYQQKKTEREVIENVSNAWNNLQADKNRLSELRAHVKSSRDVLYGYKKQFELGRRTLLDVLNTENELFRARVAYVNVIYAIKSDTFQLLATMGILAAHFTVCAR